MTVLQQQLLGLGAAVGEGGFEPLGQHRAQLAFVAGMLFRQFRKLGGQGARVDQIVRAPGGPLGCGAYVVINGE